MFGTIMIAGAVLAALPTFMEVMVRRSFSGSLNLEIQGMGTLLGSCALAMGLWFLALFINPSARWQTFAMASACSLIVLVNLPTPAGAPPKWRRWLLSCVTLNALLLLVAVLYEGVLPLLMPGVTAVMVSVLRFTKISRKLASANLEISYLKDRLSSLEADVQRARIQQDLQQVLRDNISKAR